MDLGLLSWGGVVVVALLYWLLAAAVWLARLRRWAAVPPRQSSVTAFSETKIRLSFEESVDPWRPMLVLFGPPLVLVLLKLVAGS